MNEPLNELEHERYFLKSAPAWVIGSPVAQILLTNFLRSCVAYAKTSVGNGRNATAAQGERLLEVQKAWQDLHREGRTSICIVISTICHSVGYFFSVSAQFRTT